MAAHSGEQLHLLRQDGESELSVQEEDRPAQSSRLLGLPRGAAAGLLCAALVACAAAYDRLVHRGVGQVPTMSSVASELVQADAGCHDTVEGEKCYENVAWVMKEGIWGHADWYPGLDVFARFEEVQALLHKQDPANCPQPCKSAGDAVRVPGVPGMALDLPVPMPERKPVTFYMYRAQDHRDYALENINSASLSGVMWYLHHEIVSSHAVSRKYNISRIRRFKVTLMPTWEYYNVHHRLFAGFGAYDVGRCGVPNYDKVMKRYGFIPGCQAVNTEGIAYHSDVKTRTDPFCKGLDCYVPVWYALPGPCPHQDYSHKSPDCVAEFPGGRCRREEDLGNKDCTYYVENAGEISIDELVGIKNYFDFFMAGYKEYNKYTDHGRGFTWWDLKGDLERCAHRMDQVKALFKKKFPDMPACEELAEPPCDFDMYFPGELDWPVYSQDVRQMVARGDFSKKSKHV